MVNASERFPAMVNASERFPALVTDLFYNPGNSEYNAKHRLQALVTDGFATCFTKYVNCEFTLHLINDCMLND
jgi:hypothetical protein